MTERKRHHYRCVKCQDVVSGTPDELQKHQRECRGYRRKKTADAERP